MLIHQLTKIQPYLSLHNALRPTEIIRRPSCFTPIFLDKESYMENRQRMEKLEQKQAIKTIETRGNNIRARVNHTHG